MRVCPVSSTVDWAMDEVSKLSVNERMNAWVSDQEQV